MVEDDGILFDCFFVSQEWKHFEVESTVHLDSMIFFGGLHVYFVLLGVGIKGG